MRKAGRATSNKTVAAHVPLGVRRPVALFLVVLVSMALALPGLAAPVQDLVDPVPDRYDMTLLRLLTDEVEGEEATYGIAVKHLVSGRMAMLNADQVIEAASLYKLDVMYEVFRQRAAGTLSLDEAFSAYVIEGYDDGGLPIYGAPLDYSLGDALYDMIVVSDNDAGQLLLYRAGPQRINDSMAALGLTHTTVDYDTTTTALEMLRLLELIATGRAVDADSSREMIALLLQQRIRDRIPSGLPAGTPAAHKTGNLPLLQHDAGIVYAPSGPFVIVVMSDDQWDQTRGADVIGRITRRVYDYFAARGPFDTAPPEGVQPVAGAFGDGWPRFGQARGGSW